MPVRAGPMKSVAAEADAHIVGLRPIAEVAAPDREQPEQHAFVSGAVQVVQLRRSTGIVASRIERIGARPGHGVILCPRTRKIAALQIETMPRRPTRLASRPKAEDPDLAKRIPEDGRPIAGGTSLVRVPPVDAVIREIRLQAIARGTRGKANHLESPARIRVVLVQPYRVRITRFVRDDVGPRHDVQRGLRPSDAIARG